MAPPTRFVLAAFLMWGAVTAAPQTAAGSFSTSAEPEEHVTRTQSGADAASIYRNARLGFTYKVRYGWVERTQQMRGTDPQKAQVLLAVFERPPEVSADTVNSAVLIALESAATYPGLKTAANYLGPLTELALSKGFKPVEDPYEVEIGDRWLPRADFSKRLGSLTMRQSSLVMLSKGSFVSFTFIGGSENEIEELIEELRFPTPAKANRSP